MTTRVHGMPLDQTDGCSAGILGDERDITGWRRDTEQIIQKWARHLATMGPEYFWTDRTGGRQGVTNRRPEGKG